MNTDLEIRGIVLKRGGQRNPDHGLCLLEAVAFVRGIPHTDRPPCVSQILGQFGRQLNDVLDAARLRALGQIVDLVAAERAGPVVKGSRDKASAAGAAAGAAARDAARDRLAPTVAELQVSAIDLYTRMATIGGAK